ncbi:MAG: hypothetical protein HOG03_17085 [Desulfobacula sp.]|jgi:hypothetical protein|uniref:DUF6088 family protein n=1 Tax=Desulfobacula sp. TaxID=2593537 RepID=UPI001D941A97|nr:hypothetical protein [Desulfobacula sp.]MBT3487243.1 hypothetical protein [Desulfobacula sp.]MBT3806295.1 hypothetical protein [Desulfobacula sp.]MBT4025777.1 hypothetical protein [Desulfobacula sp.]MBT4200168.1 hypothetical protein [Desulfobacula sp.]
MKVAARIKSKINRIQPGKIFKYSDLGVSRNEYGAAVKTLSRLVKEKFVKRLSTGVFYKSKTTAFGELGPSESEQLRPYLFNGRKRIAYVTGAALFNQLSLTTQVPKDIDLASRAKRPVSKVGNITVRFVKSYADVNNKNYNLLGILDSIKDFKKIPDLNKELAIKRIKAMIDELTDREKKNLVMYALDYPPRARAFLGALLELIKIEQREALIALKQSLNPLSSYSVGVAQDILPNSKSWFIQ